MSGANLPSAGPWRSSRHTCFPWCRAWLRLHKGFDRKDGGSGLSKEALILSKSPGFVSLGAVRHPAVPHQMHGPLPHHRHQFLPVFHRPIGSLNRGSEVLQNCLHPGIITITPNSHLRNTLRTITGPAQVTRVQV